MNFQEEIKKGNFIVSRCPTCDQITWPPNKICSMCLGNTEWANGPDIGTIIEFSKKDNKVFCLLELDKKLKIMGTWVEESEPQIGQKAKLTRCNVDKQNYSFDITSFNE